MKRKYCKYYSSIKYSNSTFRTGIVTNNKPKHDVIQLCISKIKEPTDLIINLTTDEAVAISGLLSDVVWRYLNRNINKVRNWEYEKNEK